VPVHSVGLDLTHEAAERRVRAGQKQFESAELPGSQIDRRPGARFGAKLRGTFRGNQKIRRHDRE
jgi:hypothetical protein